MRHLKIDQMSIFCDFVSMKLIPGWAGGVKKPSGLHMSSWAVVWPCLPETNSRSQVAAVVVKLSFLPLLQFMIETYSWITVLSLFSSGGCCIQRSVSSTSSNYGVLQSTAKTSIILKNNYGAALRVQERRLCYGEMLE